MTLRCGAGFGWLEPFLHVGWREWRMADTSVGATLVVSSSPHLRTPVDTRTIMRDVLVALVPCSVVGVWLFGPRVLAVMAVGIISTMLTEYVVERAVHKPSTLGDLSAAVAGLLLALVLPPTIPLWIVFIGGVVAMGIAKHLFGGLGYNPFNPALIARCVLLACWPAFMTAWRWPISQASWLPGFDAVGTATPLALMKLEQTGTPLASLFLGNVAGCIGETSKVAVLLGAAYLLWKGHISLRIPASFILTAAGLALVMGQDPLFHVLSGGLLFGAFFMATDYVTTPVTPSGQVVFGVGCGVLTMLIRIYGGYPEATAYSILMMNAATAFIDRVTKPRRFGEVRARARHA